MGEPGEKESASKQIQKARRKTHYGEELRQNDEQQAEALIQGALQQLGWKEADLRGRRKGDPAKLAIAEQFRKQSAMTIRWIAERLHMGAPSRLSHLLNWSRCTKPQQ